MTNFDEIVSIDDIKYMAQGVYGLLPKGCEFVQKVYTLQYGGANEFSDLLVLENPIFVTNVQVATELENVSDETYISASANDINDLTAFNIGNDGVIEDGGAIWKYLKVSGSAVNGAVVTLTLVGYELKYKDGGEPPHEETNVRSVSINVTGAMEENHYFLVAEDILLSANTLVFQNGVLVSKSFYTLNKKGDDISVGYISFISETIHDGDIITILY